MCGIAGYLGPNEIDDSRIAKCQSLMRRRGPDHVGVVRHQGAANAVLLHSRLSIIDLGKRSNQPMHYGDQSIAFNGELYNYLECRDLLKQRQIQLQTKSDTEVLLRLICDHGLKILDRCEGMWAFALFDKKTSELALCRDRFGEKPLYVLQDSTGVYFGSEIKFIAALRGAWPAVNTNHLLRYLVNGYKALYKTTDTFYEDVYEVPAGSVLKFDAGLDCHGDKFWSPVFNAVDHSMSFEEAVEGTRDKLIESVKLRLRADVPIAFCLSGGIDSNALIAIAKRLLNHDVHGFTIMNTDERYEERDMVEHAVNVLDLRHTSIPAETKEFLPRLRELIRCHDAPVYTITYFAHWLLMEAMSERGYKISMSGTGADELFSGYYDHHNAYLYDMRNEGEAHKEALTSWKKHIEPIVRNPYLQDPEIFIKNPKHRDHIFLNADAFTSYTTAKWREEFSEEPYSHDLLRNRMSNELFHESVPVILHEDDLNAMYFSIENRSPFLDRNLYEFSQTIPTKHLIKNGRAKAVLREAVRGLTADPILNNPRKVGFNLPIFSYLDVNDKDVRAQLLDDSPIFEHLNKPDIEAMISRPELENSASKFLFNFVNAKIFLEERAVA
jgi:asparagine synthase (glutamine-hydrolysing)